MNRIFEKQELLFHDNWQFALTGLLPDAEQPSAWSPCSLPHDWSTEYPVEEAAPSGGGGGYAKTGIGWYRNTLTISHAEDLAAYYYLHFEGVYMDCTVYINDIPVGSHGYGYTPFVVPLNSALKVGDNVITVCVKNDKQPNSRWYSGSGIFRNVHLIIAPAVHIAPFGIRCATNGIYQEGQNAVLLIDTELKNESSEAAYAAVLLELLDANGERKTKAGNTLMIPAHGSSNCQIRPELSSPHLWDTEDPYLYTLKVSVYVNDRLTETKTIPIGIRTATFHCDQGFLLNGKPVKIKGMCLHHDCGVTGAVGYREVWERRLKILKDMGCNGIRCSHNPPDTILLDLCDRYGFLVMDEIFDEWYLTKHKNNNYYSQQAAFGSSMFFSKDWEQDLVTMIRRDYNHPSVILWSVGNEIPEQSSIDGAKILRRLKEVCHREDSTRMVTCACDNIASGNSSRTLREFEEELDVVGYNYTGRWRERAETFYDEDRRLFPTRRICGSENPSVGGIRGVYDKDSFRGSYTTATLHHEPFWRYIVSHDFVAGDFLWTGIDYLGECRWPNKGAACAPIDTAGLKKDAFYYFRSIWNTKELTLHLAPTWNWEGEEGTFKQVICYTNCEEVSLYINDRLVGRKGFVCPRYGATREWYERNGLHATTNDLHLSFDVPYEPGILKAIGYINGQEAATCLVETVSSAVAIVGQSFENESRPNHIYQIELSTIDSLGRHVPNADHMLHCEISEGGRLIGMDNGNPADLTPWASKDRALFSGKLLLTVQKCSGEPVKIRVTAKGLKEYQLTL